LQGVYVPVVGTVCTVRSAQMIVWAPVLKSSVAMGHVLTQGILGVEATLVFVTRWADYVGYS